MRITYYRFPQEMTARERILAWRKTADPTTGEPPEDMDEEKLARAFPRTQECSVSLAKKLLRKYGGEAFTQHFDRNGGLFETSPICLKGNNTKFHYNQHL